MPEFIQTKIGQQTLDAVIEASRAYRAVNRPLGVRQLVSHAGSLYAVTNDGRLWIMAEGPPCAWLPLPAPADRPGGE